MFLLAGEQEADYLFHFQRGAPVPALQLRAVLGTFTEVMTPFESIKKAGQWLYRQWMRFAHVLSIISTTVLLTVIYVAVIGPVGVLMRAFGKDPLERRWKKDGTYWRVREGSEQTLESVRQQF
jgi:hypothetical protein